MTNAFSPDAPSKDLEVAKAYVKEFVLTYRPGRSAQQINDILERLFARCYQDGARAKYVEMTTRRSRNEEE